MTERRRLEFASLDHVMPEVERLLAGCRTVGRWTLGQILNHLATAIRITAEIPASSSEPTREQKVLRRRFFHAGQFPEGLEAPLPLLLPQLGLDPRAEANARPPRDRPIRIPHRPVPRPSPDRPLDRRGMDAVPLHSLRPPPRLCRSGLMIVASRNLGVLAEHLTRSATVDSRTDPHTK